MFDVLVVTHGHLGEECLATAHMVYGELGEHVEAMGFAPGQSAEILLESIVDRVLASGTRGGCLVLCDVLGGSPFLMASQAYQRLSSSVQVEVVSGLSLGMVLEVCSQREGLTPAEGARVAIDAAAQSTKSLSESLSHEEAS